MARRAQPLPSGAAGTRPIVAIVGRPNVGKSTLFNRLAGARIAIVEDVPGVTRDRHYADAFVHGREYVLIDTGGFDPESDDPLRASIARHVKLAIEEADVIVCVLDGSAEPQAADREAVRLLRQTDKPVFYAANKVDSPARAGSALDLYELGVSSTILPVSALHGRGVGDLEEAISRALPKAEELPGTLALEGVPRIAIVGRPNAGKSSLVNRLLGEERQIVDARPGTTVDSVDALLERDGKRMVLIDTAGIRRRRSVKETVEAVSVLQAIRAIERSDIVVMMIDAAEGVAEQDAKIAGLAEERGRALVIALNKSDLLDARAQKRAVTRTREVLAFVPWAAVLPVSARTGRGVARLMDRVHRAADAFEKRVTTSQLNRFFEEVLDRHPPPTHRGKAVRLYYVSQIQTRPPTFMAFSNEPEAVHFSYKRYVANQLRERFGFEGTPLRVLYRRRRRRGESE